MTNATKTPVNSIKIPARFVRACIGWEGGTDCMLRAVTSTGNLTTGIIAPSGCDGCMEKWYLTIWRELSFDLGHVSDRADSSELDDFEEWVDNVIIPRLEDGYGLTNWDGRV